MIKVEGVSKVSGGDHRLVESCLRVMQSQGAHVGTIVQTGEEGAKIFNDFISAQDWNSQKKNDYVRSTLAQAKQNLLLESELEWFKKSDRACYWVWIQISRNTFSSAPNSAVFQPGQGHQPALAVPYGQLYLKAAPSSTKERYKEIVRFFDRVAQPLGWQQDLVAYFKSQWAQIYRSRKPFTWLKQDNEDQIRWAWEYLSKMSFGVSKPSVFAFAPTSCEEIYLAIYAAFDSWDALPDSKRLFTNDFNKAWQQKKHRDNRQGKKACNLVLREEIKQKLDNMAAARGMKLNQFVETLIENEYAKVDKLR
ncbi:hypothetical protein [uncultured Amphritea sp.]|uniref:hypothetical protein n=1 Tax=uncultured Amphritea sp. TaxID=981605 RepID=UPI00261B556B|nr:hypothetical protein [uncultured Amphritea sp.]